MSGSRNHLRASASLREGEASSLAEELRRDASATLLPKVAPIELHREAIAVSEDLHAQVMEGLRQLRSVYETTPGMVDSAGDVSLVVEALRGLKRMARQRAMVKREIPSMAPEDEELVLEVRERLLPIEAGARHPRKDESEGVTKESGRPRPPSRPSSSSSKASSLNETEVMG